MSTLTAIVVFTLASGLFSAIAAGLFLLVPERGRRLMLPHMVSFATGALLGAALLGLVPHAVLSAGPQNVHGIGVALLCGIGLFFVLEKFLLWRHCHTDELETHEAHEHHRLQATGALLLAGDSLHNMLDGVVIAAAFLTEFHLGVVTAVAIVAHEIPQELGNFAVLLNSGMSRGRALFWNVVTSCTAVVGGVLAWFALRDTLQALPYAVAVAAASLIYVAVADLIPGLHKHSDTRASIAQVAMIAIGVALVALAEQHAH